MLPDDPAPWIEAFGPAALPVLALLLVVWMLLRDVRQGPAQKDPWIEFQINTELRLNDLERRLDRIEEK